jgi:hypothetical protein
MKLAILMPATGSMPTSCPTSNFILFTLPRDWYRFNVLQRIHMNYIENLSFATVSTLAAGFYDPKAAAYMGLVFMFGRYLIFLNTDCCIRRSMTKKRG